MQPGPKRRLWFSRSQTLAGHPIAPGTAPPACRDKAGSPHRAPADTVFSVHPGGNRPPPRPGQPPDVPPPQLGTRSSQSPWSQPTRLLWGGSGDTPPVVCHLQRPPAPRCRRAAGTRPWPLPTRCSACPQPAEPCGRTAASGKMTPRNPGVTNSLLWRESFADRPGSFLPTGSQFLRVKFHSCSFTALCKSPQGLYSIEHFFNLKDIFRKRS